MGRNACHTVRSSIDSAETRQTKSGGKLWERRACVRAVFKQTKITTNPQKLNKKHWHCKTTHDTTERGSIFRVKRFLNGGAPQPKNVGNMTSKTFNRATRPSFLCARSKTNILVNGHTLITSSALLEEFNRSKTFDQKIVTPAVRGLKRTLPLSRH